MSPLGGFTNFLIIEAQGELGGRMPSAAFGALEFR